MLNWIWDRFTACEGQEEQRKIPPQPKCVYLPDGTLDFVSGATFKMIESLKQQLNHKTEFADAQKTAYERDHARVAELEAEIDELTASRDSWRRWHKQADEKLGAILAILHQSGSSSSSGGESTVVSVDDVQQKQLAAAVHQAMLLDTSAKVMLPTLTPIGVKTTTADESPIGDSVGEETAVIDRSAVTLPAGVVDSAKYGEA